MLRINISSTADVLLKHSIFNDYYIPDAPGGTNMEINGDLIMRFEDEEEAVAYLDQLEDQATAVDNEAPEKPFINAIITAISNDEFVQAYLQ